MIDVLELEESEYIASEIQKHGSREDFIKAWADQLRDWVPMDTKYRIGVIKT
jgi:hypothetical protein